MQKIQKEQIINFSFLEADVLQDQTERIMRFATAQKARTLGNIEKLKATISFHTTDGIYEVSTTVWDVDNEFIMLKGASALPLRSVYSIRL
jgi:hypothetical protein